MQSNVQFVVIVALISAAVMVPIVTAVVFVKFVLGRAQQKLDKALAGQPILLRDMVNFLGLASKGAVQVRGNGSLALTRDTLAFQRAMSNEPPLSIPRSAIQKVESTRSLMSKKVGRLTVHFTTATGETDVVTWLVRDLDRWLGQLGHG